MASQAPVQNDPAAQARQALGGGVVTGENSIPSDNELPDQSDDIAAIFGLGGDAGSQSKPPEGADGGGASPPSGAPAADGGEGQTAQPATPPTPQPQPGQQGEPQAPAQQPPAAPAAPPAAPEQPLAPVSNEPSLQSLQAQVQALVAQNAALLQQIQSPQGAGTQAPQPGPADQQPTQDVDPYADYRLAIPDDVTNAIFGSDDVNVARQGMQHLVNSLAKIVHQNVLRSVSERVLPQEFQRLQAETTRSTEQERMRQEYFGAYPQHNDPGIRLIVAQEAQTMWTQNPALPWDDAAKNALGQRVNARLGVATAQQQVLQQQQPAPQPAPQPPVAPVPAAMLGNSNRPPQTGQQDEGDFMISVLGGGFNS